jgi:hypothetical protein
MIETFFPAQFPGDEQIGEGITKDMFKEDGHRKGGRDYIEGKKNLGHKGTTSSTGRGQNTGRKR